MAIIVVVAFAVGHLIAAARAELIPDESYYWLWSQNLSAGYYDHPPMVALWIAAGTRLFGDSALAIRLLTVLTVPFVSLVLYGTARTLFEAPSIATRAVIWFNVTLLIALAGFVVTPDAPSLAFWSLAVYGLAKTMKTGDGRWWLAVGLFAGLGAASKYTNLFLGVGIVFWLLADRPSRRWLLTPWPYLGGLAAILVFMPVLLWNAGHEWVSFAKQFGRIHAPGFRVGPLLAFVGTQLVLLNPFVALLTGAAVVRPVRGLGRWRREMRLLVVTVAPLVIYLVFHSLSGRVEGNWTAPIYPALVLLAAAAVEDEIPRWLRWLRWVVFPFGLAFGMAGLVIIAVPVESLLAKIASPRFVGWNELAKEVERQMAASGATWVATAGYATTSELTLHLPEVPVIQVNERARYAFQPEPVLPQGAALLVAAANQDVDKCFAGIRPLTTFVPTGLSSAKGFVLSLAETPPPDLIAKGCQVMDRSKP